MKRFTSFLVLLAVAMLPPLLAVSVARADASADAEESSEHPRLEQMAAELNLSDEQKAAIGPILRQQAEDFRALQADTNLGRRQKFRKARDISNRASQGIKAQLSPEQQEKYDELRAEMKKEMKKRLKERKAQQSGGG